MALELLVVVGLEYMISYNIILNIIFHNTNQVNEHYSLSR